MVISIGNNKGGVGKTSICCNLAVALGRLNMRILVLDMDSQCNATDLMVSSDAVRHSRGTMYEMLDPERTEGIDSSFIIETRHVNVSCIPNIEESSALDIPLGKMVPDSLKILKNRLQLILQKSPFDIVLIDNPPSIGLWLTMSLVASDCVIVPIDAASSNSITGLGRVIDLVDEVSRSINPSLRFLRLVINRADFRTIVTKHIISRIRKDFPDKHFKTIIPQNTAVQQAEFLKKTVFEHDSSARSTRAYRQLAVELLSVLSLTPKH